jgi:hypothetical protein
VLRESKAIHQQVVLLESELKAIGVSFSQAGAELQSTPPTVNIDFDSINKDVARLPQLAASYAKATAAEADKKAEREKLEAA